MASDSIARHKFSSWVSLVLAFLAVSAPFVSPSFLRSLFGLVFLCLMAWGLGARFGSARTIADRVISGLLIELSVVAVIGTLFFYFFDLSRPAIAIINLIIVALLYFPAPRTQDKSEEEAPDKNIFLSDFGLKLVHLLLVGAGLYLIYQAKTTASIVSPWQVSPSAVYLIFFLSVTSMIALALRRDLHPLWYAPLYILSLSVAVVVFPLGFGFDPFIHQATEKILLSSGTIIPKPPYYAGYYSLIIWLKTLTPWSLEIIDSWLAALTAAIFLPMVIIRNLPPSIGRWRQIAPLLLLLVPYGELIQSTPQALSFIWALLVIIIGSNLTPGLAVPGWLLLLLALAAAFYHPLTGIPLVAFAGFIVLRNQLKQHPRTKKFVLTIIVVGAFAAIPVAFKLLPLVIPAYKTVWHWQASWEPLHFLFTRWYPYLRLEDFIYNWLGTSRSLELILALVGFTILMKNKRTWQAPLTFALILFASYLLMEFGYRFPFIASSEAHTFSQRLLTLSFYFLLPLVFTGGVWLWRKTSDLTPPLNVCLWLLAGVLLTVSWYGSYPRFDARSQSKGFTVSADDLLAVNWIDADAGSQAYIVLSNQTMSAAAVKELGFAHYYNENFFYPLPTSGRLYQLFLNIVETEKTPNQVVAEARSLTGIQRIYIVVHDYWNNAPLINATLETATGQKHTFGDDVISVFTFP